MGKGLRARVSSNFRGSIHHYYAATRSNFGESPPTDSARLRIFRPINILGASYQLLVRVVAQSKAINSSFRDSESECLLLAICLTRDKRATLPYLSLSPNFPFSPCYLSSSSIASFSIWEKGKKDLVEIDTKGRERITKFK
jgi:hypothetical protein